MATSWTKFVDRCKSRFSALARSCYLGREHWKEKCAESCACLGDQIQELSAQCKRAESVAEHYQQLWQEQLQRAEGLEQQLEQAKQSIQLPDDPPASGQHYGASFMALSVNLARTVGLRKSVRAMKIFFKWLKVEQEIPSYQAVRGWMLRLGLDRLHQVRGHDDWIWIADHSQQIGQQECLTVLGVRESKLPPAGTPLRLQDMTMLAVSPSPQCRAEDVLEVYRELVQKFGVPRAVITDAAAELRKPIQHLKTAGRSAISIRDPKHFLANRLAALLGKDQHYQTFLKEMGQARSAMQQTELSHLAPPVLRKKSRFMNLEPVLQWASMALWQLEHPQSLGRQGISDERLDAKLKWLAKYKVNMSRWKLLQSIMSKTLTHINEQGLQRGTVHHLRRELKPYRTDETKELIAKIIKFFLRYERKLYLDERLPMSSEIIESAFGRFKALEQNHAGSGFTQLVLAFPCLLKATSAIEITKAFSRTKVRDTQAWMKEHLAVTHNARRQAAYREYRRGSKGTNQCATTLAAAA